MDREIEVRQRLIFRFLQTAHFYFQQSLGSTLIVLYRIQSGTQFLFASIVPCRTLSYFGWTHSFYLHQTHVFYSLKTYQRNVLIHSTKCSIISTTTICITIYSFKSNNLIILLLNFRSLYIYKKCTR